MNIILNKKKIILYLTSSLPIQEKIFYLINLGKNLPLENKKIRKKKNIIYGCQSNVWIKIKKKNKLIYINGDSDTSLIKGLLIIIIIFYNNKKIKKIKKLNINKYFKKLNLTKYLSTSRTIGITYIIKFIYKKLKIKKKIKFNKFFK